MAQEHPRRRGDVRTGTRKASSSSIEQDCEMQWHRRWYIAGIVNPLGLLAILFAAEIDAKQKKA
jgi:hypothetical protein